MLKTRLRYSKTGKAKYVSHLDLMTLMRRAFLRSGFRLKYSEGFNPHPYISVALPLPVGCGSVCELMDIGLADDERQEEIAGRVNAMLPEGFAVREAYRSGRKFSDIAWIEIRGVFNYSDGAPQSAAERLTELFSGGNIIIKKKTKRGFTEFDAAPHIKDTIFSGGSDITMTAKISAQNPTINTADILSILDTGDSFLKPDHSSFTRMEIFDENIKIFR